MILDCIDNYKDLCTDIEVQECIIQDIERELIQLQKLWTIRKYKVLFINVVCIKLEIIKGT